MSDSFELERFVEAQEGVYAEVVEELRAGWKRGHWMWFIFPQLRGLGHSPMAERYAIGSREEAEAYLKHAVLGPRLRDCTRLVVEAKERTVQEIFGFPDDLKFRSCMTLFAHATDENEIFKEAVEKYFGGEWDVLTIAKMKQ
ncbi:MAG TPA: DUF1810 domain-containing protein [Candidatus Acidoferrum sp.]|nr:DUF1810 domain-containing protein [Candidatus Acidoferrum sp.]